MIGLLFGEIIVASLIVSSEPNINEINYIDTDLPKYSSVVTPNDSNLGTGKYKTETRKLYSYVGSKPSSYTQKILYKYPKSISAPIEVYGTYMSMNSGSSYQLSYSNTKSNTQTYSLQVSSSISESLQSSVKIESGIGVVKAEGSATKTLGFETTITNSIEDSYTSTINYGETINFMINETGTYRLETRGMFDVYIVEYITCVYDVKRVGNKYVYTDTVAYYTIETSYILSYIEGTKSIGLFKYNYSDKTNKYELDIINARKLFGSNTLNFMD